MHPTGLIVMSPRVSAGHGAGPLLFLLLSSTGWFYGLEKYYGQEPGGGMSGEEQGVDSTGTQPQRPAKTGRRWDQRAKQAEVEQKETGVGTRRAG